jgi:hypothetical protein
MFADVLTTYNKNQHSAYLTALRLAKVHDDVDLCLLALKTMMMDSLDDLFCQQDA